MKCEHVNLEFREPKLTGVKADITNEINIDDKYPEYIMYRKYTCKDCGKAFIVLNAIVE